MAAFREPDQGAPGDSAEGSRAVPLAELLGPTGPLARRLPGYELRPSQLEMALAVERALREERIVLCEAGTGTGKTLAYLLPALLSGRKVVVSTATRALQEQLFWKDLPLLLDAFQLKPRVALMKGLNNYVCRRRLREFESSEERLRPRFAGSLPVVQNFVRDTQSGDLAELAALAEDDPIRGEIAASSDTRLGSSCPHYDTCFVTRMKREADAADLVVVNHHLFFADLALRGPHPARVLPDYDSVIFDEAHQLEDIATEFFSVRVGTGRLERLLNDLERWFSQSKKLGPLFADPGALALIGQARHVTEAFFRDLSALARDGDGRVAIEPDAWLGPLRQRFHALDSALEGLAALCETSANSPTGRVRGAYELLVGSERRATQLREQLATIVDGGRGRITWLEVSGRRVALSATPVELSILLRERVFERVPGVVLTSATLSMQSSQGPFNYLKGRLGLSRDADRVDELVLGSPFDFQKQALLYTPRDLPSPGTAQFFDAAARRCVELIRLTQGGAFVLTTSIRAMRELHRRLLDALADMPVFLQGELPKAALIARFRSAGSAVLVATSSFWEGVDIPGQALRLVILEKIPFPVPNDPIVSARSRALDEAGEQSFMALHVPLAAIALKQGFGRLIRSQRDTGIVALLDERVHRRGYGKKLLAGLPNAARAVNLAEVREFWSSRSVSSDAGVYSVAQGPADLDGPAGPDADT